MKDGIWRTISGRRLFIKNGQSLEEAMVESGKFPNKAFTNTFKDVIINYEEATEEDINQLQEQSNYLYAKLTNFELNSINNYTIGEYEKINKYLVNEASLTDKNVINLTKEQIKTLDNIIEKFNINKDLIAYRGTDKKFYENFEVEQEFTEKIYYSTSLKKYIADDFLKQSVNPYTVEIHIPKGSKGLYIGYNAAYYNETELLLARNTKYKVKSKNDNKIILEVVG